MNFFDLLNAYQQRKQQSGDYAGLLQAMFTGTPQDSVNITPRVGSFTPGSLTQLPPQAVAGALGGTPPQWQPPGNMQPLGADNTELASRAGTYGGPAPPLMNGPQADQLKSLFSGVSAATGMPLLSALTQQEIGAKAPIDVANDHTLIARGPDGKYGAVYTAPPKTPTFSEAPHPGINPTTGKPDQFIIGNDGTQKWLNTSPGPNIEFVNGQPVDKNTGLPIPNAAPIPQQAPQPTAPKSDAAFNQEKILAQIRADNAKELKQTASGSSSPPFSDAQATLFAEQALSGDKSVYMNVGRNQAGRTQIAQKVADLAGARGIKGADLAAINAAFAGDVRAQQVIGQRTGAIAISGEEARGVANLVKDAYAKLPRGEFKPFNELQAMYANQTNSPEQGAAAAADFSLATAYARALNPQGIPRETDIAAVGKMINTNGDSYEKHAAVVDQILKEIDVISQSTGAARVSQLNKIRAQHGLPAEPGGGVIAPATNSKIDDLLKKYGPK